MKTFDLLSLIFIFTGFFCKNEKSIDVCTIKLTSRYLGLNGNTIDNPMDCNKDMNDFEIRNHT